MSFRKSVAAGCAALILSAVAVAQAEQIGQLSISQPWTRATPPKAQTAGGFLTIENAGTAPDRLVGASSPIAGRVEIHEMRMDNGVMESPYRQAARRALPPEDSTSCSCS